MIDFYQRRIDSKFLNGRKIVKLAKSVTIFFWYFSWIFECVIMKNVFEKESGFCFAVRVLGDLVCEMLGN
jgi:hypothetical protein